MDFIKKILLIHPPSMEVYSGFDRKAINRLPIGLSYIAAIAESKGFDTEVIDAEALKLSLEEIKSCIDEFRPDVVGVTCTTPLYPVTVKITELVKEISERIITIIGGPHVNALPAESLTKSSKIDYVVFGEGEETFGELLNCLNSNERNIDIPGVGYRHGMDIIIGKARKMICDLDSIPFPARHKFPMERYYDPDRYETLYTLVTTSRGCPYRCTFCGSSTTWGRRTRFRSVGNILNEIDIIVQRFNIYNITFSDDTFTYKKDRVLDLCKGINARKYKIEFLCSSRINTIDFERSEMLAKAGCKEISFGVESGDEGILKTICKDIDLNRVKAVFDMVKSFGIRVHSSYIIGNPGDTHETIEKTINFAIESGTDAAQFSISTPYPGTPLWQMAMEQKKLKNNDYGKFNWYYSVVANLSYVSDEDLINYQRNAYKLFEESK